MSLIRIKADDEIQIAIAGGSRDMRPEWAEVEDALRWLAKEYGKDHFAMRAKLKELVSLIGNL